MENISTYSKYWTKFIEDVQIAEAKINCLYQKAWYRGQESSNWDLTPSILRFNHKPNSQQKNKIRKKERLIKAKVDGLLKLKENAKSVSEHLDILKVKGNDDIKQINYYNRELHFLKNKSKTEKEEIKKLKTELHKAKISISGEREIFDEYSYLTSKPLGVSSWEVLGEMRHFGIPTRLLDFTENIEVALYFSLETYFDLFDDANSSLDFLTKFKQVGTKPCIWILNPYRLSNIVVNRPAIVDILREDKNDYYNRILVKNDWEYDFPIPIYPPSIFERLKAQNGFFLCFGNNKNALNKQGSLKQNYLTKKVLEPEVVLYAIYYLKIVKGFNKYYLFKDLDSLGSELRSKFIKLNKDHNK